MSYIAKVNSKYFAAATLFAAKADVRYFLCGVAIQPLKEGGVAIVATNGHMMYVMRDPDGRAEQRIIVGGITASTVAACKKSNRTLYIVGQIKEGENSPAGALVSDDLLRTEDTAPELWCESVQSFARVTLIDGKYPNWERSIKAKGDSGPVSLNPNYLERVAKAIKMLGGNYPSVTVHSQGEEDMCIFRTASAIDENLKNLVIAVMPVRMSEDKSSPVPEWVSKLSNAEAGHD